MAFALSLNIYCNTKPSKLTKTNKPTEVSPNIPQSDFLTGTWIHDQDSLATVQITSSRWTFMYAGEAITTDTFHISKTSKLPQFVKPTEKAEFIILTNTTDTMYYEILNLDDKVLSILSYPSGRLHLYNRKKKGL